MRLLHDCDQTKDELQIGSYDITHEKVIHLVVHVRGGPRTRRTDYVEALNLLYHTFSKSLESSYFELKNHIDTCF